MLTEAAQATLVQGVRVFTGDTVITNTSVLIEQGVVADVRSRIVPPPGSIIVDGCNRTLLPGFIDCHTHAVSPERTCAHGFGITTELDMFGSLNTESNSVSKISRNGSHEDLPEALVHEVSRESLPLAALDRHHIRVLITAAHVRRRFVIADGSTRKDAEQALSAGVDAIAHLFLDAPCDSEFVAKLANLGVVVIPTLSEHCKSSSSLMLVGSSLAESEDNKAFNTVAPQLRAASSPLRRAMMVVRRLHLAGVPILAGSAECSGASGHGWRMHQELELLTKSGLPPVESLAAATSAPARCLGLTDRGRIARGLHADLVLVEGDPTVDITASRRVVTVWYRGQPIVGTKNPATEVTRSQSMPLPRQAQVASSRWTGITD